MVGIFVCKCALGIKHNGKNIRSEDQDRFPIDDDSWADR